MAFGFKFGKLRFGGFRLPKFGVRGNLFSAFAVIAAMAIIISAGAGTVLRHLESTMVDLSGRDIPRLAASLQLQAQSASLASQGPALLAARSEDSLKERAAKVAETQTAAMQKLGEVIELGADKTVGVCAHRNDEEHRGHDQEPRLGGARATRGGCRSTRNSTKPCARRRRISSPPPCLRWWTPRAGSMRFSPPSIPSIDDVTQSARVVEQLGNVIASGNLMASNLAAALSATISDTLEAIEKEFKETIERVKSNLEMLPKNAGGKTMGEATAKLQALGQGKTGIFKIRQKELDAADYGETILEETRKLNVGLGISVQQLVDGVRKETDGATLQARQEISLATLVMAGLGVATLLGSVLFVWLYVGRSILRRIRSLQTSMKVLSSGDLESEIYRSRPGRRNRRNVGIAAGVPREHDQGARAVGRPGQG